MSGTNLPEAFADLEPYVAEWNLPTMTARTRKRHASSMDEITGYYSAIQPRLQAMLEHLSEVPYDGSMPGDERRLLGLALMLAEVTTAVEWYKQPGVVDGFDPERFVLTAALP